MPKKSNSLDGKTKILGSEDLEKSLNKLSHDELKELLLINSYKIALTRAQLEAVIELLIKNKIMTYEEVWKRTNEIFKENKQLSEK